MNRLVRLSLMVLLLVGFLTPAQAVAQNDDDSPNEPPLDLAAMALLPADTETVGLDDFGVNRFGYPGNGADILRHRFFVGNARGSFVEHGFAAAGLRREYTSMLVRPNEDATNILQQIEILISEYGDEDGAEAGFALMTDVAFTDESPSSAEALDGSTDVGDESTLYRYEIVEEDREYTVVAMTLRIGHITARVAFTDFDGGEPEVELVEELGGLQAERIEAGLEGDLPGSALSIQMPRFAHDAGNDTYTGTDGYVRIAGETIPSAGETDTALDARNARYGDAVDVYSQFRRISVHTGAIDLNTIFSDQLLRFESEGDAEDWMADAIEQFERSESLSDIEEDDSAPSYGDESATYTYSRAGNNPDEIWNGQHVYMRVGDTVAVMYVQRFDLPLTPALDSLARAQAACIDQGACDNPVLLPTQAVDETTDCPAEPVEPSSADEGEVLWCFEADSLGEPVLANGLIYVWAWNGFLYAVEPETGELAWRVTPGPAVQSYAYAPLVTDNLVIVALRNFNTLLAYDAETGQERWRFVGLFDDLSSPIGAPWIEGDLLSVIGEQELLRIDPETGEEVERLDLELDDVGVWFVEEGVGYATASEDDQHTALAVDTVTGEELWNVEVPDHVYSNIVMSDGLLYLAIREAVLVLDADSGEIVNEINVDAALEASTRLTIGGDLLFVHYNDASDAEIVAIDIEQGEVAWTYELWSHSVDVTVSGETVYVSGWFDVGENAAVALELESGEPRWISSTGGYSAEQLLVGNGMVFAATLGGTLLAISDPLAESQAASNGDGPDSGSGDDEAEDDSAQESGSGGGETYESELYGYTLTYDPDEWSLIEDQTRDDDYDWVSFVSAFGFVSVIGDPDYGDGELERCVADYETVLENADGVSDVEELRDEGGEDDDRVWAVFVYEWEDDEGDTATYIRSVSCQAIDDELTLVVMHDALEDNYEALIDEGETLLAGFEAA